MLLSNKIKLDIITAGLFALALLAALFFDGTDIRFFTLSYFFIVLLMAGILSQRYQQALELPVNSLVILAITLLAWLGFSGFFATVRYLAIINFFWLGAFLLVFLLYSFYTSKTQLWKNIWPLIYALVVLWAIYGLYQHYYLQQSANATFLNRNSLAALINLALLPASAYFLLPAENRHWAFLNNRVLSLTLMILFLCLFVISGRGASVSLLMGLAVLLVLGYRAIDKNRLIALLIILFISYGLYFLSSQFMPAQPQDFASRMVTLADTAQAGHNRFIIWQSLLPLFDKLPWHGLGLGSLWLFWPPYRNPADHSTGFYAHNDYMQVTLEAGYPALILLIGLFIAVLYSFIRALKQQRPVNERLELIALFSALLAFSAHSMFTYNFYILPLSLIVGLYLGRFNQLATPVNLKRTIPALKQYFSPILYLISAGGLVLILLGYFSSVSLSAFYNLEAKKLFREHHYQQANALFLRAQRLAPLMDSPLFNHANLLRIGAERLESVSKQEKAQMLRQLAFSQLQKAEKLNPLRPQIPHIRGLLYRKSQPEKAKRAFTRALQLDPRFLHARIQLAEMLHDEHKLNRAMKALYEGVNYNYPVNEVLLEYMQYFARLARETGALKFANRLERNIDRLNASRKIQNR